MEVRDTPDRLYWLVHIIHIWMAPIVTAKEEKLKTYRDRARPPGSTVTTYALPHH